MLTHTHTKKNQIGFKEENLIAFNEIGYKK